jgi:hypothetical protein
VLGLPGKENNLGSVLVIPEDTSRLTLSCHGSTEAIKQKYDLPAPPNLSRLKGIVTLFVICDLYVLYYPRKLV